MSLVLMILGAALVSIAFFDKVPGYGPGRPPSSRTGRPRPVSTAEHPELLPRVRMVPARLTERGKALLTVLGGSALIVAFFLALSAF